MYYKISGLVLALTLWILLLVPPGAYPQVTIAVGDGSGDPGSCATPVEVSLENPGVRVKGVSMDICEVNNTLIRLGCDTTPRTPAFSGGNRDFNCISNELPNGCVRVLLFSNKGTLIDLGSGPVFALKYGVFEEAGPAGSCIDLRAENVLVAGENGPLGQVGVLTGQFCYFECSVDADCSDGDFCNGIETCVTGACQPGTTPCPDDGLFCTGVEGCDEIADSCTQGGNPCRISCDETNNVCLCSADGDCDDGLFCNGTESCNGTFCLPGTNPCPPSDVCDENSNLCVECFNDSDCDDGVFCNGAETCVAGSCQAAAATPCPPLSTCDEVNGICQCTEDAQCDDGLYCNGVERCLFGGRCDISFSYFSDYPCKDCTPTLDDCDCDEGIDACVPVALTVENGSGAPGTAGSTVAVSLDTLFVEANGVIVDICDADNFLTCTGCESTGRTPAGFSCLFAENANGCCRVTFIDFSGVRVIEAGTGPIFNVFYSVDPSAPAGACRSLDVQNEEVTTTNVPLDVNVTPGQFCFASGFAGGSVSGTAAGGSFSAAGSLQAGGFAGIPGDGKGLPATGMAVSGDGITGQGDNQAPVESADTCPFVASLDDQGQINTLRSFRDNVLSKNIIGQIFTHLFYRNAPELTALLKQHEDLRERVKFLVDEYSSMIGEVADGGTACLWKNDRKSIVELLEDIKDKGGAQLRADIDLVLEELRAGEIGEIFGITIEK